MPQWRVQELFLTFNHRPAHKFVMVSRNQGGKGTGLTQQRDRTPGLGTQVRSTDCEH